MKAGRTILVALASALALAPARAAPPSPPPPKQEPAEIIVQAHRLTAGEIDHAVRALSRPTETGGFESQYARWAGDICVLVAGLPKDAAQFVADRIGVIARGLALRVGGPGCAPSIFILASNDPTKLIDRLRIKRQGLVSADDRAVLDQVRRSHDAVRWIGLSDFTGQFGTPVSDSGMGSGGHGITQTARFDGGSRLIASTQTRLIRETILVDTRRLDGIQYQQLADYLALVSLAQLSPDGAPQGVPSILSLFTRQPAPEGLTAFDRAYLNGLYRSDANATGTGQMDYIAAQVRRAITAPAAAPTPAASQASPPPR
ncbi:hypothetical protein [Sphingomonas morindae]|uniref:DUF2927 domain-containing protein n=1 Tax=Sphingomonas morindae TaxID=1541170 RepID=A0ABY4XD30_9SPHN|nr:hypothetical protein [Sphingomonas morindae]USI74744.1 hypothetical protein LHA26_18515 [Sphingomonas morindae]